MKSGQKYILLNNLEVNTVCEWNLASLCHIPQGIISSNNSTKNAAWELIPGPFEYAKN